ncbi:MAG: hypothetical protein IMZ58_00605 [Thermoplasmata archaeon]|nr:hypothetical protein [Thermoplasmata archaeon]
MTLQRMKQTPDGWGIGYIGVSTIACRKKDGIHIVCTMSSVPPSKEEEVFTGTEIVFDNIDKVAHDNDVTYGHMLTWKTMACSLATGIIKCSPEKEHSE